MIKKIDIEFGDDRLGACIKDIRSVQNGVVYNGQTHVLRVFHTVSGEDLVVKKDTLESCLA